MLIRFGGFLLKKKTIYEILHCIGFLLCLFVAVVCGGDSHPLHQKTMFDSWERPQDQTEEQSTDQQVTVPQETEINDTTFSDLYETEDVTSESIETENFNELPTLVIERSESCPVKVTVTVEKQTTEHTYRMRIKFSELPKNHTFGTHLQPLLCLHGLLPI